MSQILLIGYGAIGSYVYNALQDSTHSNVAAVLCRDGQEANVKASLHNDIICINDTSNIPTNIDLIVECAGHAAVRHYIPTLLRCGKDVICVSNGALSDISIATALEQAATEGHSKLQLLSGAIGGIDMLAAAKTNGLESVCYRGIKPPAGWIGSPAENSIDLDSIRVATTHFKGSARQAASAFPKNANVAATVALAGIGLDNTHVELIADPASLSNRHEVEAIGAFGRFTLSIEGNPLPANPRSSALTAMSIVRAIENRNAPIVVG